MMNKWILTAAILGMCNLAAGQGAFVEQRLTERMAHAVDNDEFPVLIMMLDVVDVVAMHHKFKTDKVSVKERPKLVMQTLKQKAQTTQAPVVQFIESNGLTQSDYQRFWISNSIALTGKKALIEALAARSDIAYIYFDLPEYGFTAPEKGTSGAPKSPGGIEPGLAAIGAPEMWAMGYTGHGRMALTFDTGIWPNHPTYKSRFLPNRMPLASTWLGFDSEFPIDKSNSHGTHVSGIMLGVDTATADTIGMAPRAYFIATDPIVVNLNFVKPLSVLMTGFEWAMNPDGDEDTTHDIPDVINNSWGRPNTIEDQDWGTCSPFVIPVMLAVEAAGIANVFSAGNNGPNMGTVGIPADINTGLVNNFSVGAVSGVGNGPWNIANFSSRGPSPCGGEGSLLIKPEVVAPGVNVRSAVGNDGYDQYSGTSMASPHVSGAVLLLKEAFPFLTGEEILLALYYTAIDQGEPGEDNVYGNGMIQVKAAFDYLAETYDPVPPALPIADLELVRIDYPNENFRCGSFMSTPIATPVVTIGNNGISMAETATIHLELNGGSTLTTELSNLNLAPGATVQVTLPEISLQDVGRMELHIWIEPADEEYDLWNNHGVARWIQLPAHPESLLAEDFENGIDTELWTIYNPDASITWDIAECIQPPTSLSETGLAAWMNHHNYILIANQKDLLISPVLGEGLFDVYNYQLRFDYFYRRRSNNNFQQDTLTVYAVSCHTGERQQLFKAGGIDLATVEQNQSNAFPQSAAEWSQVLLPINLEWFYFYFETTNRRGNNLLVDNVNIDFWLNTRNVDGMQQVMLYPNPSTDLVYIHWHSSEEWANITIFDLSGKLILAQQQIAKGGALATRQLDKGMYLVQVNFADGTRHTARLVHQ